MKGQGKPHRAQRERDITMIRDQWFKNHKVRFHKHEWKWPSSDQNQVHVLEWRNPESWNFAVRYVIWSKTLYISGDLGEAVHQWGQAITFPWVARCDLGYYAEKCQASESGRVFVDWDHRLLVDYLKDQDARDLPWLPELLNAAQTYGGNKEEWMMWLNSAYNNGTVGGIDTEYLSAISDAGYRIALRCMAHWLGIKMAVEQMPKLSS